MPNFCIINSDARTIELHNVPDYTDALKLANLKPGAIDFGTIGSSHGRIFQIIVYEYGLMAPIQKTYFRLGSNLFAGNAVIFAADLEGTTIDFPSEIAEHWKLCPEFEWLLNASAAEAAIRANKVLRPTQSINGEVVWSWNPNPTTH